MPVTKKNGTAKKKPANGKRGPKSTKPTTKKTSAKKKAPGTGYVKGELPYPMKVRGNLHLKLKAVAAELGQARAEAKMAAAQIDAMRADPKLVHVFIAQQAHKALLRTIEEKHADFTALQLECAKKLKIPPEEIHNYTYDTDTGVWLPSGPTS